MDDDFNTADAIGSVFELVRAANTAAAVPGIPADALKGAAATLRELCGVLGVVTEAKSGIPAEVEVLAEERAAARKARDWKRSDELRDKIHGLGFEVSDTPQGQKLAPL
jgi:cysteinyl-tRNA synthetase